MFRQFYEDTGAHHPAHLSRPPPRPDSIKYLDAFRTLGGFHLSGLDGPKLLSIAEINAYAEGTCLFPAGRSRSKLFRMIRLMENHWAKLESK